MSAWEALISPAISIKETVGTRLLLVVSLSNGPRPEHLALHLTPNYRKSGDKKITNSV